MKVAIEKISPKKAEQYLKINQNIRNPNHRKIAQFCADMKNGDWDENGETLKFIQNGDGERLVDGQNRLRAIIESGKTLSMVVVRGIASDRFVDTGEKRTITQYLTHEGIPYAHNYAGTVAYILLYKEMVTRAPDDVALNLRTQATHAEKIKTFQAYYEKMKKYIPRLHNKPKGNRLYWQNCMNCILTLGTCPKIYPAAKDDFIEYTTTGENLSKTDPLYQLRELQLREARDHYRSNNLFRLAIVAKAWNAHRDNHALETLTYSHRDPMKMEAFPRIR